MLLDLRFCRATVLTVSRCFRSSRGPNADQTGPPVSRLGLRSVSFVAGWVIRDTCPPHIEHTDMVTLQLGDQFLHVHLEQLDGFKLMAPEEDMATERELATPAGRVRIVGDQNCVAVIGIGSDRVVVCPTKARIDNAPTFMSRLAEKRTDRLGIDVFIEYEAHLRDR